MDHRVLGAGVADADAHAGIVVADMRAQRAQPVVPGIAAAGLDPELARRQVELVVEHVDVALLDLQVALGLGHRAAAVVHVGLRLQEHDALSADAPIAGKAMEALAPRPQPMPLGNALHGHEADVVALARMLAARIAEADEELHGATFAAGPSRPRSRRL